jgi:hypothetical protein
LGHWDIAPVFPRLGVTPVAVLAASRDRALTTASLPASTLSPTEQDQRQPATASRVHEMARSAHRPMRRGGSGPAGGRCGAWAGMPCGWSGEGGRRADRRPHEGGDRAACRERDQLGVERRASIGEGSEGGQRGDGLRPPVARPGFVTPTPSRDHEQTVQSGHRRRAYGAGTHRHPPGEFLYRLGVRK